MDYEQKCVICGQHASVSSSSNFSFISECEHCGKKVLFDFNAENYLKGINGIKFKACLYYYFTHYKKDNGKVYLISDVNDDECNTVSVNKIMSLYPRNLSERIDMILQNLASIGKNIGADIIIFKDHNLFEPIFFIDNSGESSLNERDAILNMMSSLGYISNGLDTNMYSRHNILFRGWQRIDELNSVNALHGQGFIAMKFSPDLGNIKDAIKKAIEDAGYRPQVMDELQHNGQVVPEMLYQIRMSDFLVETLPIIVAEYILKQAMQKV